VVDLSNFYLDIAKDRLYVSAPGSFRRRSCQTVMALVVERLAGLIAPVLCHMAEDIWQNLPYPVTEASVFERGWPLAAAAWSLSEAERAAIPSLQGLRALVNRQLETCRNRKGEQAGIGSSLETRVQLALGDGPGATPLRVALEQLGKSPCPEVDNLADWLLVSELQVVGASPAESLAESLFAESRSEESMLVESGDDDLTIRIFRADGEKCERCWHYETDVSDHVLNGTVSGRICGRCVAILNSLPG
jgi:isoleucyl-tRNA synthetase